MTQRYPSYTPEEINRVLALEVNKLMGTLPTEWMTQRARMNGSMIFLARNWTYSNVDEVVGMAGRGLGTRSLNQRERNLLGKEFRGFWTRAILMMLGSTALINRSLSGHWNWDNEEGHRLDIDLGFKDKKGREVFIPNPLYRAQRDIINWALKPRQSFLNKMEPVLKTTLEELFNTYSWSGKPIVPPGASAVESLKMRGEHIGFGWSPIEDIFGFSDRSKSQTLPEKLVTYGGSWVSHGLVLPASSYKTLPALEKKRLGSLLTPDESKSLKGMLKKGQISGNVAVKLKAVSDRSKFLRTEEDKQIDSLLMNGQEQEARQLMEQTKRYKTKRGERNRIKKFSPEQEQLLQEQGIR